MFGSEFFEWNRESLRSLRLRLGWSKSDLARRLGCSSQDIDEWEMGRSMDSTTRSNLEMIYLQAETVCDDVKCTPAAENECDRKALDQIDFSRVKADLE
jgi:Predicted transcriptional regulators